MNQFQYIITHPGIFHADDVLACALINIFVQPGITIHRRKATPEELASPNVIVVDTGFMYDTIMRNFDHHQNPMSPAASSLVLAWLVQEDVISTQVSAKMHTQLFDYVSKVDCGIIAKGGDSYAFPGLIRNYNNVEDGFTEALKMAESLIRALYKTALLAVEGEKRWYASERWAADSMSPFFVVIVESGYIPDWQQLAENGGIRFILSPNSQEPGKWQLTSRDSTLFQVPESSVQTYRHPSGFMAVYPSKETALAHMETFLSLPF